MQPETTNVLKQIHNMLMNVSTTGDSSILMARALLELRGLLSQPAGEEGENAGE